MISFGRVLPAEIRRAGAARDTDEVSCAVPREVHLFSRVNREGQVGNPRRRGKKVSPDGSASMRPIRQSVPPKGSVRSGGPPRPCALPGSSALDTGAPTQTSMELV